ncbi:phosphoglycerate mutase [Comamonas phosphati]|nr:phosphoglycerate mutase [Comamonas phosphati]
MKTLWLVRHARPLVAAGCCYGRLDVAVDPQATQQAARSLHQALAALQQDCLIRHSPLRRCEQLALALQGLDANLTSTADARLQEMDFGQWEGMHWDAIGEEAIATWADDLARHAPGDGEPLAHMLDRVNQALQGARLAPAEHIVWICHAGVARCAQWLLAHGPVLPQSAQWTLPAPRYGQWMKVRLAP